MIPDLNGLLLGATVRVLPDSSNYASDWKGEFIVVGIAYDYQRSDKINVSIASQDEIDNQLGCTDGFSPDMFYIVKPHPDNEIALEWMNVTAFSDELSPYVKTAMSTKPSERTKPSLARIALTAECLALAGEGKKSTLTPNFLNDASKLIIDLWLRTDFFRMREISKKKHLESSES